MATTPRRRGGAAAAWRASAARSASRTASCSGVASPSASASTYRSNCHGATRWPPLTASSIRPVHAGEGRRRSETLCLDRNIISAQWATHRGRPLRPRRDTSDGVGSDVRRAPWSPSDPDHRLAERDGRPTRIPDGGADPCHCLRRGPASARTLPSTWPRRYRKSVPGPSAVDAWGFVGRRTARRIRATRLIESPDSSSSGPSTSRHRPRWSSAGSARCACSLQLRLDRQPRSPQPPSASLTGSTTSKSASAS